MDSGTVSVLFPYIFSGDLLFYLFQDPRSGWFMDTPNHLFSELSIETPGPGVLVWDVDM